MPSKRFNSLSYAKGDSAVSIQERNKIFKEVQHGKVDQLKLVHEKHPDFHWSSLNFEKSGDTPIHICGEKGYADIIEYLLVNFKPNAVDCRNNHDKTALHVAAQFSQSACCQMLSRYGADVNAIKRADWTPLMLACTKPDKELHPKDTLKTVELLLSHGALPNLANKDGWTTLHLASREGSIDVVDLLLKEGADPNLKTKNGRSVLHIAALHGNIECIEKFVNLGLNIEEKECCGNTALQEALLGKNLAVCKFLIESGANIYCKNHSDLGLLHLAASTDDIETINFVLSIKDNKFNINEQNFSGWTPLHCAARKNLNEVFEFLVQKGANKLIKDKFGRTPVEYFSHNKGS